MTHPLQMSVSTTGWNVEGDLLESVAIELHHSELFGNEIWLNLKFKSGRVAKVIGALTANGAQEVYDCIQREMMVPAGKVIEH